MMAVNTADAKHYLVAEVMGGNAAGLHSNGLDAAYIHLVGWSTHHIRSCPIVPLIAILPRTEQPHVAKPVTFRYSRKQEWPLYYVNQAGSMYQVL